MNICVRYRQDAHARYIDLSSGLRIRGDRCFDISRRPSKNGMPRTCLPAEIFVERIESLFLFRPFFFPARLFEGAIRKRPNTVRCLAVKCTLLGTRRPELMIHSDTVSAPIARTPDEALISEPQPLYLQHLARRNEPTTNENARPPPASALEQNTPRYRMGGARRSSIRHQKESEKETPRRFRFGEIEKQLMQ